LIGCFGSCCHAAFGPVFLPDRVAT
jgi:hypothetical protein